MRNALRTLGKIDPSLTYSGAPVTGFTDELRWLALRQSQHEALHRIDQRALERLGF